MTGMKEGAGEDPFADDEPDHTDDRDPTTSDEDQSSSAVDPDTEPVMESGSTEETTSTGSRTMQIPYKFRRDSVQEGRDRVPLFLHPETKTAERNAMRELEDKFDDNVSMTDLREALVKVGLDNLEETAETLEEWGYGVEFE